MSQGRAVSNRPTAALRRARTALMTELGVAALWRQRPDLVASEGNAQFLARSRGAVRDLLVLAGTTSVVENLRHLLRRADALDDHERDDLLTVAAGFLPLEAFRMIAEHLDWPRTPSARPSCMVNWALHNDDGVLLHLAQCGLLERVPLKHLVLMQGSLSPTKAMALAAAYLVGDRLAFNLSDAEGIRASSLLGQMLPWLPSGARVELLDLRPSASSAQIELALRMARRSPVQAIRVTDAQSAAVRAILGAPGWSPATHAQAPAAVRATVIAMFCLFARGVFGAMDKPLLFLICARIGAAMHPLDIVPTPVVHARRIRGL